MSDVKRKRKNKCLKKKCEVIHHTEKGMAIKKVSKKFRVPKEYYFNEDEMRRFL